MKKPMLKEIRGKNVWLRLKEKYLERKREDLKGEGRKEETKGIEEEEISKLEDTVEGREEEIYHDPVEETVIEAREQAGVKCGRRNGTTIAGTSCVIGSNDGDKKPARRLQTNEMIRRRRV